MRFCPFFLQQFFVCEEQLGKALQLASDFKLKIDEEEAQKQGSILQNSISAETFWTNFHPQFLDKLRPKTTHAGTFVCVLWLICTLYWILTYF
jgi:hypothetical protein